MFYCVSLGFKLELFIFIFMSMWQKLKGGFQFRQSEAYLLLAK